MPILKLTIISTILLMICSYLSAQNTQTPDCSEYRNASYEMHKQFSRMSDDAIANRLDSLFAVTDTTCSESMIYLYTVKGRYIKKSGQLDSALHYYNIAQYHAVKIDYANEQKNIANLKAAIFSSQEETMEAIDMLEEAIAIPCHPDSSTCIKSNVKLMINRAVNLRFIDRYEEAIQQFDSSAILMDKYDIQDSIWKVAIHNGIGTIYEMELDDDRMAIISFKNAMRYCPYNHPNLYTLMNNIGNAYTELDEIDSARYYLNKTINSTDVPRYLITPHTGLGDILVKKGDYDGAIKMYLKAVQYGEASGHKTLLYNAKSLLGKAYYKKGLYNKAKQILDEVITFYDADEKYLNNTDYLKIKRYHLLCQAQIMNTSYGSRLDAHLSKTDSIGDINRLKALDASITRFNKRKTDDSLRITQYQLDQVSLKATNQRLSIISLLLGLVAVLLMTYFLLKAYKAQKAKNKELIFRQEELNLINSKLTQRLENISLENKKTKTETLSQIEIPVLNRKYILKTEQVSHYSAENTGCRIYMDGQSIWTELSLKEVSNRMTDVLFVQIYRSTVVNINYVEWVNHATLMLTTGEELKIGRSYKSDILSRFN